MSRTPQQTPPESLLGNPIALEPGQRAVHLEPLVLAAADVELEATLLGGASVGVILSALVVAQHNLAVVARVCPTLHTLAVERIGWVPGLLPLRTPLCAPIALPSADTGRLTLRVYTQDALIIEVYNNCYTVALPGLAAGRCGCWCEATERPGSVQLHALSTRGRAVGGARCHKKSTRKPDNPVTG